jgi:hypothetical protein
LDGDTGLRGGWWAMPEYRSTMKGAYFKPSQLIMIQQVGGSDDFSFAAVFRHVNNKFQKVGDISKRKLGDFIKKQLSQKK